jgi:hypothetical protein
MAPVHYVRKQTAESRQKNRAVYYGLCARIGSYVECTVQYTFPGPNHNFSTISVRLHRHEPHVGGYDNDVEHCIIHHRVYNTISTTKKLSGPFFVEKRSRKLAR